MRGQQRAEALPVVRHHVGQGLGDPAANHHADPHWRRPRRCRHSRCWPPVTKISVPVTRSEEHTSELQSLMRISYAVFCLKNKKNNTTNKQDKQTTTIIVRCLHYLYITNKD